MRRYMVLAQTGHKLPVTAEDAPGAIATARERWRRFDVKPGVLHIRPPTPEEEALCFEPFLMRAEAS